MDRQYIFAQCKRCLVFETDWLTGFCRHRECSEKGDWNGGHICPGSVGICDPGILCQQCQLWVASKSDQTLCSRCRPISVWNCPWPWDMGRGGWRQAPAAATSPSSYQLLPTLDSRIQSNIQLAACTSEYYSLLPYLFNYMIRWFDVFYIHVHSVAVGLWSSMLRQWHWFF